MSILTTAQVRQYLQNSGFTGNGLSTGVIIVQRESGNDTLAVNKNDPYGGSYGMWQINGSHIIELFGHSITLAQAFDPQASSDYAYQLSQHGSDFHDWTTANGLPVSPYSNSTNQTSSNNSTINPDVTTQKGSGYTFILGYVIVIILFTVVSKTRIGYVTIYYLLALALLLLIVTQAKFIAQAVANFQPFNAS